MNDRIRAAEHLDGLTVVGQVRAQHGHPDVLGRLDQVNGLHPVVVLHQVPDYCPAGLTARTGHADDGHRAVSPLVLPGLRRASLPCPPAGGSHNGPGASYRVWCHDAVAARSAA
ncbi:MAG: hypothetical protein ABSD40_19430 [Streptosporangiaceae bacterium]